MVNYREIGRDTEQKIVGFLQENGYPNARRMIRTGFRNKWTEAADEGDITGTPFCWQAKSLRPQEKAEKAVSKWLIETESQRVASGADLAFLVVRRWGTTTVGKWWVFQPSAQLYEILTGYAFDPHGAMPEQPIPHFPVRLDMKSLMQLL